MEKHRRKNDVPADLKPISDKHKKLEQIIKKAQESTNKFLSNVQKTRKSAQDARKKIKEQQEAEIESTLQEAW